MEPTPRSSARQEPQWIVQVLPKAHNLSKDVRDVTLSVLKGAFAFPVMTQTEDGLSGGVCCLAAATRAALTCMA